MDDEVGGRHDEVQKGSCDLSNWTLKRREDTMKSKRRSKLVGLDVEAEGRHDEVQKGSQSKLDWTLKQGEGTMKSKKEVKAGWIGR